MRSMYILLLFAVSFTALAQTADSAVKTGTFPLAGQHGKKALAVGTSVWINMGDNACAYPYAHGRSGKEYPLADEKCFSSGDYIKARIVKIFSCPNQFPDEHFLCYQVNYQVRTGERFTANAYLDRMYSFYNLQKNRREFSNYLLQVNW